MTAALPASSIQDPDNHISGPPRRDWAPAWLAGYGATLGAFLFVVAYRAMPDDALITLAFARSVVQDGCLCITDSVSVNTMTSPLHLALLVPPLWVGIPPFWAVGGLLMAELAGVAWLLQRLGGRTAALLGTALLATSPVYGSSVGMESFLAATVIIALVVAAHERRLVLTAVASAAAVLTRPDLVVVVIAVVAVLACTRGHRLWWSLPLGAGLAMPWFAYSWWALGSAWPHTVAIKSVGGGWAVGPGGSVVHLTDGLFTFYWGAFPTTAAVTASTLALGLVAAVIAIRTRDWPAVAFAAGGTASLLVLHVTEAPPTAYYAGPGIASAVGAAVLVAVRVRLVQLAAIGVLGAAVLGAAAHGALWGQGLAPIRQNWATNDQYHAIAAGLPRDGIVLSTTEIGALAYYCQDYGCQVTDVVLSDPGYIDERVTRWRAAHPWAEVNYANYRPGGYLPARYRLDFGPGELDGSGTTWPITRYPGMHQIARLVTVG